MTANSLYPAMNEHAKLDTWKAEEKTKSRPFQGEKTFDEWGAHTERHLLAEGAFGGAHFDFGIQGAVTETTSDGLYLHGTRPDNPRLLRCIFIASLLNRAGVSVRPLIAASHQSVSPPYHDIPGNPLIVVRTGHVALWLSRRRGISEWYIDNLPTRLADYWESRGFVRLAIGAVALSPLDDAHALAFLRWLKTSYKDINRKTGLPWSLAMLP